METARALTLGVVAGEASGELLAHDVVVELNKKLGTPVKLAGVGGPSLQALGLKSAIDPAVFSLMGLTSVLKSLPRLIAGIGKVAGAIVDADPDIVLMVDSPDFSHRVAKRIRAKCPNVPIVKYVAPTVWAWRPGRAAAMKGVFDHILALYPFEPGVMAELGGPDTHYVGHRLMGDADLDAVWQARSAADARVGQTKPDPLNLLYLPGSRHAEIRAMLPVFRQVADILAGRGHNPVIRIPTLPRFEQEIRKQTSDWPGQVRVSTGRDEQIAAYRDSDVAVAASGTVLLELALAGVPAISLYKTDFLVKLAAPMITAWSGALPNIIADRPVIPEFYNEMIRPGMVARQVEALADRPSLRVTDMMKGYAIARDRMKTELGPSEAAAAILKRIVAPEA